jgi:hypothetical protein
MQTPDNNFGPCSGWGFEYSSWELCPETSILKFWCGIHVGNEMEPYFLPGVSCAQYTTEIHTINNQALTTESRWNLSLVPDHHGVRDLLPSSTCSLFSRHISTSIMWPSRQQCPSFSKTQFTCPSFQGDSRDMPHTQWLLCVMDTHDSQPHRLTAGQSCIMWGPGSYWPQGTTQLTLLTSEEVQVDPDPELIMAMTIGGCKQTVISEWTGCFGHSKQTTAHSE